MSRRRYRWNNETQTLDEVSNDAPVTPRLELATGSFYESAGRATDGTDISTRKKYNAYCKAKGVVPVSDFTKTLESAQAKRAAFLAGDQGNKARRDDVGRAIYQLEKRRK